MLWTAEAIEVLKRLAHEGRSASVIAAELGAASRNAVIGKANRIGIKLTGGGVSAPDRAQAGAYRVRLADIPHPKPGWAFAEAEVGEMPRVRFEEIREFACRWPLGDPTNGDFAYCGLEPARGRSYCAGHCRMAYRPPGTRTSPGPQERRRSSALANPWRLR
jgi:GcrA cell cycle regulator